MAAADHGPYGPGEERRVRGGHGQPQHLPLHRPDGRHDLGRQPREPPAEAARGEHDLVGGELRAGCQHGSGGPVPYHHQAFRPVAVEDHPGPLAGRQQGGGQPAGVDLVVAVDPQTAAYARRQHRFQAAALAAGEPLRLQARTVLERVQFAQMGAVVGVEGDREGAAGPVADVLAARRLQLGGEGRVARGGGDVEAEQRLLAVVEFGDGGEHAGRDPGGTAARVGVDDRGAQAALRRPPGGHQADDSAPDDEDVGSGCVGSDR